MSEEILSADSLTTPEEALELWGHSLRQSIQHDGLNNRVVVYNKVQVLEEPMPLSPAAAAAVDGIPVDPAASNSIISRKMFRGRIRDENSPHDQYPDPCNLAYAPDPDEAKRIMNCYTIYTCPPDFSPEKFSYVNVQHRVGPSGKPNLQYGRCVGRTPKSILSNNDFAIKARCESKEHLFDTALEVEIFSMPGPTATAEDINRAYPQIANKRGFADKIVAVAKSIGIPDPGWLANVMRYETGGAFSSKTSNALSDRPWAAPGSKPGCKPPNCTPPCKGLIQFCPGKHKNNSGVVDIMKANSADFMKGLNADQQEDRITAVERLTTLTEVKQMNYVEEYLSPYKGKLKTSIDLYMAIFQPSAIGKPNHRFTETQRKANNGIATPRQYAARANAGAKLNTELA